MSRYVNALRKRGYSIRLAADGVKMVISPKLPEHLRRQVIEAKDAILAELRAEQPAPPPRVIVDPRPDLAEDSGVWTRLLQLADSTPIGGALHGFRCCGARLQHIGKGYMLLSGDELKDDWRELHDKWLLPDGTDFVSRTNSHLSRLLGAL